MINWDINPYTVLAISMTVIDITIQYTNFLKVKERDWFEYKYKNKQTLHWILIQKPKTIYTWVQVYILLSM